MEKKCVVLSIHIITCAYFYATDVSTLIWLWSSFYNPRWPRRGMVFHTHTHPAKHPATHTHGRMHVRTFLYQIFSFHFKVRTVQWLEMDRYAHQEIRCIRNVSVWHHFDTILHVVFCDTVQIRNAVISVDDRLKFLYLCQFIQTFVFSE